MQAKMSLRTLRYSCWLGVSRWLRILICSCCECFCFEAGIGYAIQGAVFVVPPWVLPLPHVLEDLQQEPALGFGEVLPGNGVERLHAAPHAALPARLVVLLTALYLHVDAGLEELHRGLGAGLGVGLWLTALRWLAHLDHNAPPVTP